MLEMIKERMGVGKKERGKEERFYSQGLDRALKNEPTHTHNLHVLGDIKK